MKILKGDKGHCGDTFRELIDIWEERGYCKIEKSSDSFCWVEKKGKILLYDFPRIDDRNIPPFQYGLFANTVPTHPSISSWIFWARSPRKLDNKIQQQIPSYTERKTESIFLGKVENHIQQQGRVTQDWNNHIEDFCMPIRIGEVTNTNYKYTQEEYLTKISLSKYGLCLPGYGSKCNREIEYLGLGVIPIVTPGVDLTYYEPLEENIHYLRVGRAEEIKDKINSISEKQWTIMSNNGRQWYERNCSPEGSYKVTEKIITHLSR